MEESRQNDKMTKQKGVLLREERRNIFRKKKGKKEEGVKKIKKWEKLIF